ncbi:hypothetical protein H2248_012258 [Termitomyces sp. 'cryptogamus']|nr:hypothetical protein H2248_012258 [Termitomyces sp. 'cryptogamus']
MICLIEDVRVYGSLPLPLHFLSSTLFPSTGSSTKDIECNPSRMHTLFSASICTKCPHIQYLIIGALLDDAWRALSAPSFTSTTSRPPLLPTTRCLACRSANEAYANEAGTQLDVRRPNQALRRDVPNISKDKGNPGAKSEDDVSVGGQGEEEACFRRERDMIARLVSCLVGRTACQ